MRGRSITVLLGSAICLQACASTSAFLGSKSRIDPNTVAQYSPGYFSSDGEAPCKQVFGDSTSSLGAVDLGCFAFEQGGSEDASPGQTAYNLAANTSNAAGSKYARDRLENVLLKRADDICTVEKGKIVANEATANAGLGLVASGLAGAASIVTGELANSILAGGAAFATGAQAQINANFYRNQLTQAITKALDSERDKVLIKMGEMRSRSTVDYTVDEMIRMANRYHQACSFQHGLQVLMEAAAAKTISDRILQERQYDNAIAQLKSEIAATSFTALSATEQGDMTTQLSNLIQDRAALIAGQPKP